MAKSKTSLSIDSELLKAAAARAVEDGTTTDAVVESALRVYLDDLAAVLRRIRPADGMSEEESLKAAYEELDAYRASKQ